MDSNNDEHYQGADSSTTEEVVASNKRLPIGSAVVFIISGLCLVVVFWFIYIIWSSPSASITSNVPIETETETVEDTYVDETFVEGRNPEILGLTIDAIVGRYFTVRATGKTLYINASGEACTDECLTDWTPYTATNQVVEDGAFGTVELTEGTWQYTWNGFKLYTYNQDDAESVLGDGYDGTWEIARP